jgi:hypothetical protein
MGLDMYAYAATQPTASTYAVSSHREIAYWRKHPNLHGWMEQLWQKKGMPGVDLKNYAPDQDPDFNGTELELTWNDLEELEQDIVNKRLPATKGFFFGNNSDDHYQEQDLAFVRNAKAELFLGLKVFYNSSW